MDRMGRASLAIVAAALFGAALGTVLATRSAPAYEFLQGSTLVESDRDIRIFRASVPMQAMLERAQSQYPAAFRTEDRNGITLNVPRRMGKRYALVGQPERSISILEVKGETYVRVREFYLPNHFEVALNWMRDKLEI